MDVPGAGREIRLKVSGIFRSNNGEAIRQWVFGDLGIAVSPDWLILRSWTREG